MNEWALILAEKFHANDVEVTIAHKNVSEGEAIEDGQRIAEIETTKSVEDLVAPRSGHIRWLVEEGSVVPIGSKLALVGPDLEVSTSEILSSLEGPESEDESPPLSGDTKQRVTRKAQIIAREAGFTKEDLRTIDKPMIREADVHALIKQKTPASAIDAGLLAATGSKASRTIKRVAILGAGKSGVTVGSILLARGDFQIVRYYDDRTNHPERLLGIPVSGGTEILIGDFKAGAFDVALVAFSGNIRDRATAQQKLSSADVKITNAIAPTAEVSIGATIGTGNVIFGQTRVGPGARIGDGIVLSAFCNIEHHNTIGSFCTFGPGVMLSGTVTVGERVRFGTGVFVEPGVTIGDDAVVASGAIVSRDVPAGATVKLEKITRVVVAERGAQEHST